MTICVCFTSFQGLFAIIQMQIARFSKLNLDISIKEFKFAVVKFIPANRVFANATRQKSLFFDLCRSYVQICPGFLNEKRWILYHD